MNRVYISPKAFNWEGKGALKSTMLMLIHGFTGSPSEFRRAAYYWNDLGYSVHAVQLPGHGTKPEDMLLTTWKDWMQHVIDTYDHLQKQSYDHMIVIGHSMGGLLAFLLSLERKVDALVSLATPIFITTRSTGAARWLHRWIKFINKRRNEWRPELDEACAYRRTPVKCVLDLRKLIHMTRKTLPKTTSPLFIVQGMKDHTVKPRSADYIYKHSGAKVKKLLQLERTAHSILLDQEREQAYRAIDEFISHIILHQTQPSPSKASMLLKEVTT